MAMAAKLHGLRAASPALCPFSSQQQHRIPQERFSLSMQPRRFQIQLCVTRKSADEGSETIAQSAKEVPNTEFERRYLALIHKYPIPERFSQGSETIAQVPEFVRAYLWDRKHKNPTPGPDLALAQISAQKLAELRRKANEGSEMSAWDKYLYLKVKYGYLKHKDPWFNGKPSTVQALATVLWGKLKSSLNEDEMQYFERVAEEIERENFEVLWEIAKDDMGEAMCCRRNLGLQYDRAMALHKLHKYEYLVMKYKYLIHNGIPNKLHALAIVLLGKLKKGKLDLNEDELEYFESVAEDIERENFKVLNEIAGDDMMEAISVANVA